MHVVVTLALILKREETDLSVLEASSPRGPVEAEAEPADLPRRGVAWVAEQAPEKAEEQAVLRI